MLIAATSLPALMISITHFCFTLLSGRERSLFGGGGVVVFSFLWHVFARVKKCIVQRSLSVWSCRERGKKRKKKVANTVVTKLGCDKADGREFEMWLPADVLIFLHRLSAGCQEPR